MGQNCTACHCCTTKEQVDIGTQVAMITDDGSIQANGLPKVMTKQLSVAQEGSSSNMSTFITKQKLWFNGKSKAKHQPIFPPLLSSYPYLITHPPMNVIKLELPFFISIQRMHCRRSGRYMTWNRRPASSTILRPVNRSVNRSITQSSRWRRNVSYRMRSSNT